MTYLYLLTACAALVLAFIVAWSRERRKADRRRNLLKDWKPDTSGNRPFHYDPPQPHPRAGFGNDGVEQ